MVGGDCIESVMLCRHRSLYLPQCVKLEANDRIVVDRDTAKSARKPKGGVQLDPKRQQGFIYGPRKETHIMVTPARRPCCVYGWW